MIDTDYDREWLFVRHCYFTGEKMSRISGSGDAVGGSIHPECGDAVSDAKSRPFRRPEKGKIAVKVINHYGDEVLQVYEV